VTQIPHSRTDAPPACIAKASTTANATDIPDLSNSTITDPTADDVPVNTTSIDSTGNSTDTSSIDSSDGGSIDNPSPTDTTNSTDTTGIDTSSGNSTASPIPTDSTNSTDTSGIDTSVGDSTNNSTTTDATNSTDTSTRRRRAIVSAASTTTTTTSSAFELDVEDLAFEWQSLCLVSGGGIFADNSPCLQLAGVDGFNALFADADPCVQQTFADSIITFSKTTGIVNQDALIAFALKYRRHPRASANILGVVPSTLYCTQAPLNPELHGIVNVQPDGVNPGLFGSPSDPMVPFGSG
jgi:hypothetical protein